MGVDKSAGRVQRMFGEIAGRYDLLNRLLSAGIDRRWRRRTVHLVAPSRGPVLDVCTGTADLALAYWRQGGGRVRVVGADFCREMLIQGGRKIYREGASSGVSLVEADATNLPFPADVFEVVCVAFGLRNVCDTDRALAEMVRVCQPGGRVAVLEFALPQPRPLRALYGWYFGRVLPRIGQVLARNRHNAYNYLPESVGEFPQREALSRRMEQAGLSEVRYYVFTLGIATLHVGIK